MCRRLAARGMRAAGGTRADFGRLAGSAADRTAAALRLDLRFVAEGVIEHSGRDFALAHDDEVRFVLLQMLDLGVGMRAGDDIELRIELARLLRDLTRFEAVRDRDE